MYNNPYMLNTYNHQINMDRLDEQINQLQALKKQMQQPTQQPSNVTQNFQLAPVNRETIKYAGSIDEVYRDSVVGDTPYFSRDMSVVWIKNAKGEIKTYELTEIIPKDEKDLQIEFLQSQIEELKGMINNEANVTNVVEQQDATDTQTNDGTVGTTTKKSKSTSVSRVSRSKKE